MRSSIGITALGRYVPERVVSNAEYEAQLATTAEWIESRTGIRERRFARGDEYSSDLGVAAVRDLLSRDPHGLQDVSAVVCATLSPDALMPSTAALIAMQVGLGGAAAFDLSAACSGFVYALSMAQGLILGGTARRVLVVGAEVMSKVVDQNDRNTAVLFGDGAGAVVLGPVPAGYGLQAFALGSDGTGASSLYLRCAAPELPGGFPMGRFLGMNGREVFKFAVRAVVESGTEVLKKSGLATSSVDWVILHQANVRIIEAACERFGMPLSKAVVNLDRYGNTSSATVPLALGEAIDDGRLRDGQQLLLVAFGGGLSWAACTLKWWGGAPSLTSQAQEGVR
ncbi:beta-ketoacyl-ACP synthase III [Deinococcus hopiensis]|nr:beta-ketoacyl-ACP synthase III [Deinococcus hopiensis]